MVDAEGRIVVDGIGAVDAGPRAVRPGDTVVLGIRPEHLEPATRRAPPVSTAVEQLGGLSTIRLDLHEVMVQVPGQTRLAPGDAVGLVLPTDRLHVFGSDGTALPVSRSP